MCAATKDKLLYQQVSYDNSEGIKTLHTEGAALEDDIANTLIELGANMNAYHPEYTSSSDGSGIVLTIVANFRCIPSTR
ncbi:hypothetical protein Tco_0016591 [Tanacetum coccineum]